MNIQLRQGSSLPRAILLAASVLLGFSTAASAEPPPYAASADAARQALGKGQYADASRAFEAAARASAAPFNAEFLLSAAEAAQKAGDSARATQLASTLSADELLAVDTDTLIHRLYWEETLLTFDPQDVRWHCPCGRERVAEMLRILGRGEVDSILAEQGQVEVSCDFCGKPYLFDAVDCAGLFAARAPLADTPHPPTVH